MEIQLEDCKITSYQLGVLDNGADRTDLSIVKLLDASTPKLFSEEILTAPNWPLTRAAASTARMTRYGWIWGSPRGQTLDT